MSLMLNTLKALEQRASFEPVERRPRSASGACHLRICPADDELQTQERITAEPIASAVDRTLEACLLPASSEDVAAAYVDLAAGIAGRLALSSGNTILFVAVDAACAAAFSMVEAARAFALHVAGKVLLIDATLGDDEVSRAAGTSPVGLADVLQRTAGWDEVIRPTQIAGLDFVPGGATPGLPFDAVADWQPLRDRYQVIALGACRGDNVGFERLAAQIDATYLVVSANESRCRDAVLVLNRLRRAGANVLGTVVIGD
jgi:Mrp family chromosome partitioning ATPase